MKTIFKSLLVLSFFILLGGYKAFSQKLRDTSITQVSGYIIDSASREAISFITIRIKGTSLGMISNNQGFFSIAVRRTDTILFTAIGYTPHRLIMSEQKPGDKLFINIYMGTAVYMLKGITVRALTRERFRYEFLKLDLPKMAMINPAAFLKPGELKLPPPPPGIRFSPSEILQDIPFVEKAIKKKRSKKFVNESDPDEIPVMK